MSEAQQVAVLGGGAWGTALALVARRTGHDVRLWTRDAAQAADMRARRENARHLPGIAIDSGIAITADPEEALDGAARVLLVVPAQSLRAALGVVGGAVHAGAHIVLCAKGIEASTGHLLSEIVGEVLPDNRLAILSGPSFAADVGRSLPTAVVVADPDAVAAATLAAELSGPSFRCYSTDDRIGVEIGGALKNVVALAAGAVAGARLGASTQAALVTRGFVELRRLAASFGARPETLMGLSGLGDLILTCSSAQSRNFAYGMALGRGEPLAGLPLAEGVATARIAAELARERGVAAPIIDATRALLDGETTMQDAAAALMARPLRSEDE